MWIIYFNNVPCFWLLCNEVYKVGKHNCHVTIQNDKSISRTHLTIEVGQCSNLFPLEEFQVKADNLQLVDERWNQHNANKESTKQEQRFVQCSVWQGNYALQELFDCNCVPAITLTDSSTYGTIVSFNSGYNKHCSSSCENPLRNNEQADWCKELYCEEERTRLKFVKYVSVANSLLMPDLIDASTDSNSNCNNNRDGGKEKSCLSEQLQKTCETLTRFDKENTVINSSNNDDVHDDDDDDDDKDGMMRKRLSSIRQWNTMIVDTESSELEHHKEQMMALNSSRQHINVESGDTNNKFETSDNNSEGKRWDVKWKLVKGEPFVVPCVPPEQRRLFRITLGKHNAELTLTWADTFMFAELVNEESEVKFKRALEQCGAQMRLPLNHIITGENTMNSATVKKSVNAVLRQIELIASAHFYVTSVLTPTPLAIAMLCRNTPIVQPSFFIAIRDRHSPQQPLPDSASHFPSVSSEWCEYLPEHTKTNCIEEEMTKNKDNEEALKNSVTHKLNIEENEKEQFSKEQIPRLLQSEEPCMQEITKMLFGLNQSDNKRQRSNLFSGITFVVVQLSLFMEVAQYLPFTEARVIYDEAIEAVLCTNVETRTAAAEGTKERDNEQNTAFSLVNALNEIYAKYSNEHVLLYRKTDASKKVLSCLNCLCECLQMIHIEECELVQHLLHFEPLQTIKQAALTLRESKLSVYEAISEYMKYDGTFTTSVNNNENECTSNKQAETRQSTSSEYVNAKLTESKTGRDSCGSGRKTHAAPLFPEFEQRTEMLYKSLRRNSTRLQESGNDCKYNGKVSKHEHQTKVYRYPVVEWTNHSPVNCARDGVCAQQRTVNAAGWVSWHPERENEEDTANEEIASSLSLVQHEKQIHVMPSLPPYPCFLSYLQNSKGGCNDHSNANETRHFVKQKWLASNGVVEMIRGKYAENDLEADRQNIYNSEHETAAAATSSLSASHRSHRYLKKIPRIDADNIVPDISNYSHNYNMQNTNQVLNANDYARNRNNNIIDVHRSNNNSGNMSISESLAASFNAFDVAVHHSTTKSRKRNYRTEQHAGHKNSRAEKNNTQGATNGMRLEQEHTKRKANHLRTKHSANNSYGVASDTNNNTADNDNKYNNDDLYELFGIESVYSSGIF